MWNHWHWWTTRTSKSESDQDKPGVNISTFFFFFFKCLMRVDRFEADERLKLRLLLDWRRRNFFSRPSRLQTVQLLRVSGTTRLAQTQAGLRTWPSVWGCSGAVFQVSDLSSVTWFYFNLNSRRYEEHIAVPFRDSYLLRRFQGRIIVSMLLEMSSLWGYHCNVHHLRAVINL